MKCMTFNLWNYQRDWRKRRELIAGIIVENAPDMVALQESRHDFRFESGRGQGEQLAKLTGYHATCGLGQVYIPFLRADEGLCTLTKDPPRRVMSRRLTRIPHERDDSNQRLCLGVTMRCDGVEVHVYNTHFSLSAEARLSNASEVIRFIREQSASIPTVLMGDLNAEPEEACIQLLTGAKRQDGAPAEFLDCWTVVCPEDSGYTYASFDPVRRIDYVLARNLVNTPSAASLVGSQSIEGVYPSDHLGIVVDFPLVPTSLV